MKIAFCAIFSVLLLDLVYGQKLNAPKNSSLLVGTLAKTKFELYMGRYLLQDKQAGDMREVLLSHLNGSELYNAIIGGLIPLAKDQKENLAGLNLTIPNPKSVSLTEIDTLAQDFANEASNQLYFETNDKTIKNRHDAIIRALANKITDLLKAEVVSSQQLQRTLLVTKVSEVLRDENARAKKTLKKPVPIRPILENIIKSRPVENSLGKPIKNATPKLKFRKTSVRGKKEPSYLDHLIDKITKSLLFEADRVEKILIRKTIFLFASKIVDTLDDTYDAWWRMWKYAGSKSVPKKVLMAKRKISKAN